MLKELLDLHQAGLINPEAPKRLFPETEIFNERWLLRLVLKEWLTGSGGSQFGFLPFPDGVTAYSEGQLYTPFKRGSHREGNTHVDGIVGDFSIKDTKSGIELKSDLRYIAAFEAKLYASLSADVTYAPGYDQVSRTAACLINSVVRARPQPTYSAHLVIVHAKKNKYIHSADYEEDYIERSVAKRLEPFTAAEERSDAIERFAAGWKEVFERLEVHFLTWEEVVADIGDRELSRFYDLCKEFARPSATSATTVQHP